MTQNELQTTSIKTRIAIVFVAILMLISTAALYIGVILGHNNKPNAIAADTAKQDEFNAMYKEYQEQLAQQAGQYSDQYFSTFSQYASRPKAYNAAAVIEVTSEDLRLGDGAEITEDFVDYSAYYIGWLSDGTVFDSSFDDPANPAALSSPLPGGNLIAGWNQGIIGMKLGGIREIAVPPELGYKDQERGVIPANSPLKFVIMLIPKVADVDWSEKMLSLYDELYAKE